MAVHTREQKCFIVRHLARHWSAPEIAAEFVRQFRDTACDVHDIRAVDPERGCTDPMLVAVFDAVRAEFLARPIPISQKAWRLAKLQRVYDDAADRGAIALAMEALARAAAECGADSDGPGARRITEIVETIVDPIAPAAA